MTEDPRGIAIAGDAVRISYQLGIGHELVNDIGTGKEPPFVVHFLDMPSC